MQGPKAYVTNASPPNNRGAVLWPIEGGKYQARLLILYIIILHACVFCNELPDASRFRIIANPLVDNRGAVL